MTRRKIFFRADASADIGYGHFVRTLALADMLKDQFDCTFFTQTPSDYQKAEVAKVCGLIELPTDDTKFDIFLEYLEGDEIVVLDNYFFSTDYQRAIKVKGCSLVCIDDIHDKHYVADVVINHALADSSLFSVEPYTKLCLGFDWALLRKPFLQPVNLTVREKNHWIIAFGGSDYYNLTEKFVRLIHNYEYVHQISVVIGDAYQYESTLAGYDKLHVYKNLASVEMCALMQRCEYAILPCSSICIEAISQGCKVYAGYYVDNQLDVYNCLSDQGLVQGLGDLIEIHDIEIHEIKRSVDLMGFYNIPIKYCDVFNNLEKSYVSDGLVFINYALLPEYEHKIIWENRNNEAIRIHMDSPAIILWDSHCKFVYSLKQNTQRRYWAVYHNGELIGSVNISNIEKNAVERGIFVVPSQFGRKWGTKIEHALSSLLITMGVEIVHAKVLRTNNTSLCFHYRNGYYTAGVDDKYEYFVKSL
ncbi:MAG: UDP-2,4-diacetamido-2,4,6-trideoxy-beta-L-altropyranose hydrolase [Alistipes sp.]|nr:UDP-2,4-diacetamido-2,4,6-trideoxy-beta-L-altropyranose hydrolase [Alistipes sp.]